MWRFLFGTTNQETKTDDSFNFSLAKNLLLTKLKKINEQDKPDIADIEEIKSEFSEVKRMFCETKSSITLEDLNQVCEIAHEIALIDILITL